MPSTYTTNGGIEKIATGEQSGSWGSTTNLNFDIIDRITNGVGSIALSGASSNLQTTDGTLSDGQYKALVLGGSPSGTHTITVLPNDAQKIYFVQNGTSESVIFSQGSGSNVTIPANTSDIIYCDGGGASAAVSSLIDDVDLAGYMQSANNLSDVADAATALTNLGVTSTASELNLLDGATVSTAEINYNDVTTLGTTEASKTVTADANGNVTFDSAAFGDSTSVSSSSLSTTLNLRLANDFTTVLSENTTFSFTNAPTAGRDACFSLKITQDASASGYSVTWPGTVRWPSGVTPTLAATANAVDYFVFITNDGGTNYYGFIAGRDMS